MTGKRRRNSPNDGQRHAHGGTGGANKGGRARPTINVVCAVCGQRLGLPGGMAGTGLCGPCCTGEAATMVEKGETW